jgi:hypothetical protein
MNNMHCFEIQHVSNPLQTPSRLMSYQRRYSPGVEDKYSGMSVVGDPAAAAGDRPRAGLWWHGWRVSGKRPGESLLGERRSPRNHAQSEEKTRGKGYAVESVNWGYRNTAGKFSIPVCKPTRRIDSWWRSKRGKVLSTRPNGNFVKM